MDKDEEGRENEGHSNKRVRGEGENIGELAMMRGKGWMKEVLRDREEG